MSRQVRLLWLHSHLSKDESTSIDDLAERFRISIRQAKRDLKYLRVNLGAPLSYSREKSGYTYTHPYNIPSLFSGEFSLNITSKGEVRRDLLRAIEEKRPVKVFLSDGNYYFHPACCDDEGEVFAGIKGESVFHFLQIGKVVKTSRSKKSYIEEPLLWNKKIPTGSELEEVHLKKGAESFTYHFYGLETLIIFLLNNRHFKVLGPEKTLDQLRNAVNTLAETVGDSIEI